MDYRTERGSKVRLFENGTMIAESPLFISPLGAERWLRDQVAAFTAKGKIVIGKIISSFEDPNRLNDGLRRMSDTING